MSSTNQTVPGTGPDTTLNLGDPSTVAGAVVIVSAVIVAAVPQIGAPLALKIASLGVAGVIWGFTVFSKHYLAAALGSPSAAVPQLVAGEQILAAAATLPTAPLVAIHVATPAPVVGTGTAAPIA
jgi:hypothetical protein